MIYRMLALIAVVVAGTSEISGRPHFRAAALWPSAHPPLPRSAGLVDIDRAIARGQPRRALHGLLDRLTELEPAQAGTRLAVAAVAVGDATSIVEALGLAGQDRVASVLGAETGSLADATRSVLRIANPQLSDSFTKYEHAVAAIRSAGSRGFLAELGRFASNSDFDTPVALGPRHADRIARLQAIASPALARRTAWTWWRRARRSGDAKAQGRSLALLASLASVVESPSQSSLARAARRHAELAGDLEALYITRSEPVGRPPFSRVDCPALARAPLFVDCSLGVLASLWDEGRLGESRTLLDELLRVRSIVPTHPVVSPRLALVASPILRFYRDWPTHDEVLAAGVISAREQSRPELLGMLERERSTGLRARGRHKEAAQLARGFPSDVSPSVGVRLNLEWARVASALGDRELTRRHLDEATGALPNSDAELGIQVLLARVETGVLGGESLQFAEPGPGAGMLPDTFGTSLIRAIRREISGDVRAARSGYESAAGVLRDWVRRESSILSKWRLAEAWKGLAQHRARLHLEAGEAYASLQSLAHAGPDPEATAPDLDHLINHLDGTTALIAFGAVDDLFAAWVLSWRGARLVRLSTPADEIRQLAALVADALVGNSSSAWGSAGRLLAARTIGEIEATGALRGVETLVVLPSAGLGRIPLDALPETGDAYLGDRFVFSRVGSLAEFDRALHQPSRQPRAVAFLPLGGRQARAEVVGVRALARASTYVGPRATREAFVRESTKSTLIHFGGHATPPTYGLDSGGLSFGRPGEPGSTLSYDQIIELRLQGASVVLLGCDTARTGTGHGNTGGPPASLAEAFLRAGSRSVVGSLWSLDSRGARELASEFYRAGGPGGGPRALARAKRVLRAKYPDQPFRWAGAVWQGAPDAG